jgi:hypothetical protein
MAVVISEFEVLPEPAAPPRQAEPEGASKSSASKPIDPCAVRTIMRAIDTQTLRIWAH